MKSLLFLFACCAATFAPLARAADTAEFVTRVETCEAILQEFMGDRDYAIPPAVWERARAVVITSQFRAGIVLGVKGGWGVVLAKKPDGQWSVPVLIKASEGSLGLQLGGSKVETIMIITDDATTRKLYQTRFNVGVDAKAVAGPRWAEVESVNKEILESPVLVYTKNKGLFAGATVKAGYISRDDASNRRYYNTMYTMPELLFGNFVTPTADVQPLMNLVSGYAP